MITEQTFQLLEQMSQMKGTGSRQDKLEILQKHKEILKPYFDIAMNPYRVFNIIKIPKKPEHLHKWLPPTLEKLAEYLEKQSGGTNENKSLVRTFLNHQNKLASKWSELAILKNVKIGVEIKTLNKAGYNIPEFNCLLADPNPDNSLEGITFPAYIQAKVDGCRTIMMPGMKFFGRNGKIVPNENLKNHISFSGDAALAATGLVFDGEFYSFKRKFNEIVGLFSSDDKPLPDDIKYVIFNSIVIEEWKREKSDDIYSSQLHRMNWIAENSTNVVVVPTYIVNSKEEAMAKYQEFLDQGFEGAMVRNMNSKYQWERVKVKDGVLTKLKPSDHADCLIKGYYEGEGRHQGRLGGFILDFEGKEVRCGGGFSDEQREHFWSIRDTLIDNWCRVKYTELTEDRSLRFPVWESLRDEK